jgi:KaiC/GvpD/RAD55 family RecA-like ATPase
MELMTEESFVHTGISGVDELLEGKGLPRGYGIFVLGGPGSGKTTFGLQFLHEGIRQFGENGVYISLDEDIAYVKANAKRIGFDLEALEKENKLVLMDASPIRKVPAQVVMGENRIGKQDFTLLSLMDMVKVHVKRVGAKRLVVDPLVSLTMQFPNEVERRAALLELMQATAETRCTTLLISELSESAIDRKYQFEEFLAQGVIMMRKVQMANRVTHVFQVEKMRGLSHDDQPRPYKIGPGGIVVYPRETPL